MVEGSRVWVANVEGRLSGEILHLSPRSIEVGLAAPYNGITQGISIPYFACSLLQHDRYYLSAGRITQHGIDMAEWLLASMGRSCELVGANADELARQYRAFARQAAAETDGLSATDFRASRADLREAMRRGSIAGPEYQRSLAALRRRLARPEEARHLAESRLAHFIFEQHRVAIPLGTMRLLIQKFLA